LVCLVAGIGTVMLLPGRKTASMVKMGGLVVLTAFLVMAGIMGRGGVDSHADVYLWLFAAGAVGSALKVVTSARPVYSALYFVLTVIATAGLFILMWAEFMAAALVMIYAGAILVTYVFVIMLASEASSENATSALPECDAVSREPLAASAVGFFLTGLLLFLIFNRMDQKIPASPTEQSSGMRDLARYVFENQVVSMELAGILLTLGMVGAILIARRQVGTASGVQETFTVPDAVPDVSDDPHSIPVHGSKERN
jgi:NADH-quinone oxidoreductase subunit J